MTDKSESMLASAGRAAPLDSAAGILGLALTSVAVARPDIFEGFRPDQVAAICTGLGTLGALIRAWARARRRSRRLRRAAQS